MFLLLLLLLLLTLLLMLLPLDLQGYVVVVLMRLVCHDALILNTTD